METSINRLALANKTVENLVEIDPLTAYKEMGKPMLYCLTDQFHNYAAKRNNLTTEEREDLDHLITTSFDATTTVVTETLLRSTQKIGKAAALAIAHHEETVRTMHAIAQQDASQAIALVQAAELISSPYMVNPTKEYITFAPGTRPGVNIYRGCPVLKMENSEEIPPLFTKFVRWSGAVAVHSMYKRRFTN